MDRELERLHAALEGKYLMHRDTETGETMGWRTLR